ncbi:MAG: glycerophosphodiester phosphodiesterase family protein [Rubrivivax sp.]
MTSPIARLRAALAGAALALPLSLAAQPAPTAFAAQLGPRPFFLVDDMSEGPLKAELQACMARTTVYGRSSFSIAHRGAPLQFPEHTLESYRAAARMGAGVLECDVTFTKDKELVCRHSQNDLHTTTNILATPLAATCIKPFTPAIFDATGKLVTPASAECRTSEITLAEFKSLRGKKDAFNPRATTVAEYLAGTAPWRTDLYSGSSSGTLLSHRESVALFRSLGVKLTPELKAPVVPMPFDGFTQDAYAQKLVDELVAAGVSPQDVYLQSFQLRDVLYWLDKAEPFGRQAVLLDEVRNRATMADAARLKAWREQGVRIVAPPLFALLELDAQQKLVPSRYARDARAAGLQIITWSLERSGFIAGGRPGYFYQDLAPALRREGDVLQVLDVLARDVGVLGVFSDWPATATFYAHCKGLR